MKPILKYKKTHLDAIVPVYAHDGDSGMDLFSIENTTLQPGEQKLIDTGIILEIPYKYEGQVRPKSGLALKYGITITNSPGTIDSLYRDAIKVILKNTGDNEYVIEKGQKIAQLVICPVEYVQLTEGVVNRTSRGKGGFGSTGLTTDQQLKFNY